MVNEETIKREFDAFKPIKDNSPKFVLSLDKIDLSHDGITHINIVDFLLGKKDIFKQLLINNIVPNNIDAVDTHKSN